MTRILNDIRAAVRGLTHNPQTTIAAVLSLALGIGVNMTVFGWAAAFLFRPIAGVANQSNLVFLEGRTRSGTGTRLSYPDFTDLKEHARSFEDLVAFSTQPMSLATHQDATRVWGQIVTGNFFEFFKLQPAAGRFFSASEDQKPNANPVVVISFDFWHRRFAGDPSVIGRTVRINKYVFTLIGVAPRGFYSAIPGYVMDLWAPLMMQSQLAPGGDRLSLRDSYWLASYGRLAGGVTLGDARAETDSISEQLARLYPASNRTHVMEPLALWDAPGAVAYLRPIIIALTPIAVLLLILGCANVANLLLARALHRKREMAIRMSLGARRAQILRQLLAENTLLALLSGAVGALAGYWTSGLLDALFPPTGFPVGIHVAVDARWMLFAFGLSLLTSLLFGFAPALETSNANPALTLKDESAGGAGGGRSTVIRSALVVVQVTISLVLLIGAGLFLKTLNNARDVDIGFNPEGLLLAAIDLTPGSYSTERGAEFYRRLVQRIEALPGIRSATFARRIALNVGAQFRSSAEIAGYTPAADEDVTLTMNFVGPRYLETMEIPLVGGRDFTLADREGGLDVGIVNETASRRYWRSDPVGQRLRVGDRWLTVVGVAKDSKYDGLTEAPMPYLYVPALQFYRPEVILHVRTAGDPAAYTPALRSEIREMDASIPVFDIRTMKEHLEVATFRYRLAATMLGVFGSLALVLAAGGLYSVTSYNVSRRRFEIGLRIALGADARRIAGLILRQCARLAAIGLAAGLLVSLVLASAFDSLLIEVNPGDPFVLGAASSILIMVLLLASFLPAWRASSLDPAENLRRR